MHTTYQLLSSEESCTNKFLKNDSVSSMNLLIKHVKNKYISLVNNPTPNYMIVYLNIF